MLATGTLSRRFTLSVQVRLRGRIQRRILGKSLPTFLARTNCHHSESSGLLEKPSCDQTAIPQSEGTAYDTNRGARYVNGPGTKLIPTWSRFVYAYQLHTACY